MTSIKLSQWLDAQHAGDVSHASFPRKKERSIRVTVGIYNQIDGYMRGVFIHMHVCRQQENIIVVLVTISREQRELETLNNNSYDWKESIPQEYA